jgi:predicted nucleic acid-binding protein
MKIVFDSGVIISFSETCYLPLLRALKEDIGEFIITKGVKNECIDRVRNNMRLKLSSLRIEEQINEYVFNVYEGNKELTEKTNKILEISNSVFLINNKPLKIVDFGEAECLALLGITKATCIAIDERTTRMLIESPKLLLSIFKKKYRTKNIKIDQDKYEKFINEIGKVKAVRSVDLFAYAYKNKLLANNYRNKEHLKASLYSLKFSGCSVSFNEIEEFLEKA